MSDRDNSDYLKSGNEWSVNTLDFMFWQLRPDYYLPDYDEANGFQQCTDEMKEAVREIFAHISTFADLTFTEVTDVAQTELGFGQASLAAGELAHAYYPVAAGDAREGDVWVSTLFPENYELEAGEEGYYTLLHEIGHALGLQHSFTDPDYPEDEDDTRYTVMSYTFPVMPKTYMLYDILALQEIYGANMTYRTGDDAYAFSPGEVYNTIWDAGGTDTITAATHTANAVIDLRQGEFSYIGASSMIIAFDVTIENAVGGYGNDTLHENGGDNTIDAGWGNDTVYAQDDGDDTIDGDLGNDTVIFEGVLGDYTVVYVDPTTWTVERSGGDLDTLLNFETFVFDGEIFSQSRLFAYRGPGVGFVEEGTSGDDVMTGGALNDTFWAKGGDDTLAGLAGDDRLYGETGDDILDGGDDNDTLDGSTGNDTLTGGDGDDTLVSGTGTDIVDGGLSLIHI